MAIVDDTLLQDSPPPKVTDDDREKAARYVEREARNDNDCRELLEALGLAPTTSTGGTR